jgi:hypothetical protein
LVTATVFAVSARGDEPKSGIDAKTAFARLKALAGEWKVEEGGEHGSDVGTKVIYRVTAAGSALVEEQFPGTSHEMVSVYHLDGDDLRMTHYCAAGNQPRMRLDRNASTPDVLVFSFDGGTNLDPAKDLHIHEAKIHLKSPKRVEGYWIAYKDGKPMEPHPIVLVKP